LEIGSIGRLDGKRIVITGSLRRQGRHFALACATEGASLVVNGTNEEALSAVTEEIAALGAPVRAVLGSVAEAAVCDALVASCVDNFGGAYGYDPAPH
jgi:3-oxoacyl-[acyl-carrier protein] reductase